MRLLFMSTALLSALLLLAASRASWIRGSSTAAQRGVSRFPRHSLVDASLLTSLLERASGGKVAYAPNRELEDTVGRKAGTSDGSFDADDSVAKRTDEVEVITVRINTSKISTRAKTTITETTTLEVTTMTTTEVSTVPEADSQAAARAVRAARAAIAARAARAAKAAKATRAANAANAARVNNPEWMPWDIVLEDATTSKDGSAWEEPAKAMTTSKVPARVERPWRATTSKDGPVWEEPAKATTKVPASVERPWRATTTGWIASTTIRKSQQLPKEPSCLCVFDVDRTLTGSQDLAGSTCPRNRVVQGIIDPAYRTGNLTISALGQAVNRTFCAHCHLGVVSAGSAGGPAERGQLRALLQGLGGLLPGTWSGPKMVNSPLVVDCPDARKASCVADLVDWYKQSRSIEIAPWDVFFFDDLRGNTRGFAERGYNARQVSCASRDASMGGVVGLCGALPEEIIGERGIRDCN